MQQKLLLFDRNKNNKPSYLLKLIVFIIGLSLYLAFYFLFEIYNKQQCIQDLPMEWMLYLNSIIADNKILQQVFIGVGQVCIDSWVIFMAVLWTIKIKNFRFPAAMGLSFGVRFLILGVQKFPFTQHWVWDNPGFPSIVVPYDKTRDFFYSGHTAMLVIVFFQLKKLKWYKTSLITLLCLLYIVILLLTCQVHYTTDIIGAIIFSNYIYQITQDFLVYFDKGFSLPYFLGQKLYKSCSSLSKQTQKKINSQENFVINSQDFEKSQKIQNTLRRQ